MIQSDGKSGRDEQRDNWREEVRDLALDTTEPTSEILAMGLESYMWVHSSVETTIRRVSPGLNVRDRR